MPESFYNSLSLVGNTNEIDVQVLKRRVGILDPSEIPERDGNL